VVGVLTAPLWGPWTLSRFRFFDVRRVEVRGARYVAPATIAGALGLTREASVWGNTKAMERRVAALAGVRSVDVARRLPGTLVVTVTEVEPVALAEGPAGLVPVDEGGRLVEHADTALLAALATVRITDFGLFADIAAARAAAGGAVVLDLEDGRLRVGTPLDPAVVHAMAAVRRDLAARGQRWAELDGRFRGWVVVRRPAEPVRQVKAQRPARRVRPARRRAA